MADTIITLVTLASKIYDATQDYPGTKEGVRIVLRKIKLVGEILSKLSDEYAQREEVSGFLEEAKQDLEAINAIVTSTANCQDERGHVLH